VELFHTHRWDLAPADAIETQRSLMKLVVVEPLPVGINLVGGVDVGFRGEMARAAVVVLDYPSLVVLETAVAELVTPFPYVPGLLSFREIPVILEAMQRLKTLPDAWLVDGQGIAHPRRFGLASHLGVLLEKPTVGCAKSVLIGKPGPLGEVPGSHADLVVSGEVVGAALRSRLNCKPLIVSIGHRTNLRDALQLVTGCLQGHRLPEPSREAHRLASRWAG
jgi:deoxyribonuclease V